VAKKDRVPTPPKRPVQAPKAYRPEHDPRRSRWIFIGVAALIVVAAAAVGIGFIMSGGDDDGASGAVGGPGDCQLQTFPALEASHVDELPDDYEYNSVPATSGLHNAQTAIWNLYDEPVPQINSTHNLEHGGVLVQYGSEVPDSAVAQIGDWYQEDTRGLIVAPLAEALQEERPELADKVVLTAWTHMMTCATFDEDAFDDFVDDYRGPQGDAPEKFPLDSLAQGSN
jgi:Protein of unknown function (DUF3105)